ncbi:PREDICTED: frizzled-8 [Miniopterus natalensis]|uniref:frizzled-8 n=1 Tax=Miniopterus natalensis TaxID=291302 RepID=UPI0007A716E2|nr:PREDICTED: frizzled-8 [Miniopterus natalensis]
MEWCYLLEVTSLLAALALLQLSSGAAAASAKELACQEITVPLCKGIGYNYTYMPNQFNHDTQDEAGLEVHQFWPLVEIQCSPDLKFFLCSMYTPICLEDYKKPLPPCRSVCERAKAGCAPLMRQYGFAWPDRMRCDRLPEQGNPDMLCMDYNRTDLSGEYQELGAVEQHVRYETTGPALCTVVFLLVYFFGMASSIWWVILSLTWFLAAGMKWGNEAIAGYSQYFHLAAWLVPSVKSIAVLALSSVDGDPVAGICYVGNQSLDNLRGFVLAPLVIYLFIGTMFLLAGFVSLFRIRSVIKQQGGPTKTHKLEKLMIRLGLFTVLYTVPAAVVVACLFYEQHNRPRWEATHNCPCLRDLQPDQARRPDYAVFMLKYFMCLVVGITSGVWVWSGKTLESWRALCTRCCWASKAGSLYSDVSTGLTWRSGTASSVSYPKQMPLSQV